MFIVIKYSFFAPLGRAREAPKNPGGALTRVGFPCIILTYYRRHYYGFSDRYSSCRYIGDCPDKNIVMNESDIKSCLAWTGRLFIKKCNE